MSSGTTSARALDPADQLEGQTEGASAVSSEDECADEASGEQGDEDEITLSELLRAEGVGARLGAMLATGPLGAMSLRQFTQDRDKSVEWMLRQQNCGRGTVHELLTLLASKPRPPVRPLQPLPEPPLSETKLIDLFAADTLSVRLFEVLRTTDLGTSTLSEYLRSSSRIESEMLRIPNCGRRSVMELRGLVGMHARNQLGELGLEPALFGGDLVALIDAAPVVAPEIDQPPSERDLRGLVAWHLARLPERTADVIALRFGLKDAPAMTLQEIGDDYGITRERIRQIEAKGLKAMSSACRRFPVRAAIDEATPHLLDRVFESGRHVGEVAAARAISSFDGWQDLALVLAHGSGEAWFRKHARRLGTGWLAPGTNAADAKAVASELRRRDKGRPFPRAAQELCEGLDPALAAAAMELVLEWRVEAGYVFARRPGPRLRRTALLHALLACERLPMEMAPLLRRYHAAVPGDICTDRDLVIVMEAATHLFLEIHEGCWTAIGQAAPLAPPEGRVDEAAEPARSPIVEEGTNATALERELARVGPSRLGELMNRAIDILPEGRSRHSVGPTLLLNPNRFVRVLPGVYALPHQVLDGRALIEAGAVDYLLNPTQARFYAVGRKAGEAWGAFPLWTATAEMRLCRWARAGDDRTLYRSLLEVASIEDWPTDEADKEVWRELKSRDARYELWIERRLSGARPPIDRVLAAAIRLQRSGSIGWVAANRILGYVPSSYAGAGLLVGMTAAGLAVKPASEHGWQLPHGPGPGLTAWIQQLTRALHDIGEIDWRTGPGRELASIFAVHEEGVDEPVADEPIEELDEYERIMAEHRQAVQARRLEARMELDSE